MRYLGLGVFLGRESKRVNLNLGHITADQISFPTFINKSLFNWGGKQRFIVCLLLVGDYLNLSQSAGKIMGIGFSVL